MMIETPQPLNAVSQDEFGLISPRFLLSCACVSGYEKGEADEENSSFLVRLVICVDWFSGSGGKENYGTEAKVNVLGGSAQFLQVG